ncbi:MAG: ChaN family lipoprotein [Candidatus Marinimicrobia bacterium]|nr:ChaN family lipoprotein [Candidatus Neomarinimicrobiota bacterium]
MLNFRLNKIIIVITAISILLSFSFAEEFTKQDYKLYDSATGKSLSLQQMTNKLTDYDVVFFGEFHDDILIHSLESKILPFLYAKKKNMAISMEMFERDVQNVVDSFLTDDVEEKKFLKNSRAWPNYKSDYKEIVEFAKMNNLDIIASNVPRRYAAMISKKGVNALDSISKTEKQFVAKKLTVLDNKYKKNFIETMKTNMKGDNSKRMPMMMNFDNIYAAQCLKDDTMAESILEYLQNHPEAFVIHFNGNFHSEYHLGTANKLKLLNNNLKIAVISPVYLNDNEEIHFIPEAKDKGDFLLISHRKAHK